MKVILRADIHGLGNAGEIKDVSPGYARNYLLPQELVWEANPHNQKLWEKEKVRYEQKREELKKAGQEVAEKIEKLSLTIPVKVGEAGKLFGSVTSAAIVQALAAQGITVDKHAVLLNEPLKEVGVYTIDVRLHTDVIAKAKVWIVEEKEAGKATEEA